MNSARPPATLLVMAGGTGGHIFPGLAVADAARADGWRVVWLGNPAGMEARLVPARGFEMAELRFGALRGKGLLRKLLLPFNLLRGFAEALRRLAEVKPDVVIGLGGFVSFPAGMMAVLKGIPLVVHEQNSVAGLANRVLAGVADRVLTGFPDVLKNARWTGNPVRAEIAALPSPAQRYRQRADAGEPLQLLVVGGSLGAVALNEVLPAALALLPADERPRVVHQAGEKNIAALRAGYAQAGVAADCLPFIEDMAAAYARADLVICRAGALTVAELAAAGVASILVPYPHAVDDHQTGNARFLAAADAAVLLPQRELSAERLAELLRMKRERLQQMAEQARVLARPEATANVVQACRELRR
ncbi:N-acetylglucosaminyl transferase [Sterolibacterium denitrificans]|uniref:UDP-N-acetylglucosamine--N-acetylmuramyl-(pentapeptide) pyrophosphoryl-undecaprenol N-acetylglucosamine transferase n=1 Tax=Sterolibacterium denitrificans TaxID=157592 RepID=A0A7Z7HN95_9PROT|nr:undecaprenyldiphospho-muramoylpentapeptide beta-N-acetylglucosaminyltransferase [Sterolibacterium denitrificans]SMB21009.1 N-acetylglucosaminyl transferase [Sterolibacterium denitrificans]